MSHITCHMLSMLQLSLRGRDLGYNSLARRVLGVATVLGAGHDNSEYQEDGAEMTEVRTENIETEAVRQVQDWPPAPAPNFQ